MRTQFNGKLSFLPLAVVLALCLLVVGVTTSKAGDDTSLLDAVCQVIYPVDQVDQSPSADDSHYIFLGNGFFVNEQGYIVTAAHLLSWFHDGAQPSILVGPPEGPRQIFRATVVAADLGHDVAVLRATPDPFQEKGKIAYLPLSANAPLRGENVVTASLRPSDINNAYSSDVPLVDFGRGEVLDYQIFREQGKPGSELLLFNQEIVPGQSGSPLVSADSQAVVGIVVGRWLHPAVIPSGANGPRLALAPGAALRVHYAISLLDEMHISWHMAESAAPAAPAEVRAEAPAQQTTTGFAPPVPLSVATTPYPPQALFGGDVVLDALIDADGKLTDLRVVRGDSPFLETVMGAVQTWTFQPARMNGHAVDARIGIVFQFPQSSLPKVTSGERKYDEPLADSADRGALPVLTLEPDYPVNSIAEGSVALYDLIDSQGKITSDTVLLDVPSLTAPSIAATQEWQFAPGKQAGVRADSAVVIVETFRRPAL